MVPQNLVLSSPGLLLLVLASQATTFSNNVLYLCSSNMAWVSANITATAVQTNLHFSQHIKPLCVPYKEFVILYGSNMFFAK
jgi:hypothetical protein